MLECYIVMLKGAPVTIKGIRECKFVDNVLEINFQSSGIIDQMRIEARDIHMVVVRETHTLPGAEYASLPRLDIGPDLPGTSPEA